MASALGVSSVITYNSIEIIMQMLWMFIGLSYQGYMIGEISSYLNFINKEDIELVETQEQIQEICTQNKVDANIQNKVLEDLDKYTKDKQQNIEQFKKFISKNVQILLERAIYKDFINTFNLFARFSSETIKILKNNAKIDKNI